MPNPQNPALASPSQNLRSSSRGVREPPADQTPVRETPLERAARREAEKKKAERRTAKAAEAAKAAKAVEAAAAAKAAEAAAAAKATEAAAKASTTGKRVVGARNNKRKKKLINAKESKKKKATQVHYNSSDSGEIESADDDSCFEPTDGADDDDDDDDQAGDDDNNDEGEEIDSYVSADSYLDDDPLALPENGRRSARKATEESRHSAQAGAVNPLRTSNSEEHGTPPPPPARADTREIVSRMPLEAPTAQKNVVRRIVLFVKNTLFRQIKFVTSTISFNKAFQKMLAEESSVDVPEFVQDGLESEAKYV